MAQQLRKFIYRSTIKHLMIMGFHLFILKLRTLLGERLNLLHHIKQHSLAKKQCIRIGIKQGNLQLYGETVAHQILVHHKAAQVVVAISPQQFTVHMTVHKFGRCVVIVTMNWSSIGMVECLFGPITQLVLLYVRCLPAPVGLTNYGVTN